MHQYYAIQNVHSPYTLPPAWETHSYPALWDHTYSNMIHMMDDMVGNLTDALKDTGAWDHVSSRRLCVCWCLA